MISYIYDPELVAPSPSGWRDIRFWERLSERSRDRRFKLGQQSITRMLTLMATPPPTTTISPPDYYAIISKLASRVADNRGEIVQECDFVDLDGYTPFLGDSDNANIMRSDVAEMQRYGDVVVASDSRAWQALPKASCVRCSKQHLYLHGEGLGTAEAAIRSQFLNDGSSLSDLSVASSSLFPELVFSDSCWSRTHTLKGDKRWILCTIVSHLGFLNDSALQIWESTDRRDERIGRFGSAGINASPESPSTRGSQRLMKQRDFHFGEETVRCEWHTKFTPKEGRVHFAIKDGVVHIGTIVNHLPTM